MEQLLSKVHYAFLGAVHDNGEQYCGVIFTKGNQHINRLVRTNAEGVKYINLYGIDYALDGVVELYQS